jgi:hypothetical protein
VSNAFGNFDVLSVALDGSDLQRVTTSPQHERSVSAAPDLPRVAFERMLAVDNSEIVLALPDGTQPQSLTWDRFKARPVALRKPRLLPGGTELVFVMRPPGRDGESLHTMRLDGQKELAPAQKDHAIIFAVSPDGEFIALHRVAEWGKKNSSIVVIDRNAVPLKTIALPGDLEIKNLSWGAPRMQTAERK